MKGIHLIFIFSIISQTLLFSQFIVKRNNQVSKEQANVNWSKEYTLFDYTTDEPIFPLIRNGQPVYKIYYASKEDPRPNYGELSIAQVEGLKYYKFKNRETCFKFCQANKLNAVLTLTTSSISGITTTTATSGGNITSDGGKTITARGVVWSTSTNPTITLTTKTSNGTGTGSFSSSLTNLTPKTTYYIRAYATNSAGTGYGNEITFTTTDSSGVMGIPCPGTPTVKDIDGNTYNTVQIGNQCWTKENLKVTKYRDGSVIPLDDSGGTAGYGTGQTWSSRTTGARTVYGHSAANLTTYGYLYNWYVVADSRGLCPSGWHVPSDGAWNSLSSYLGNEPGVKLADTSWILAFGKPTNESGFSVKPGGYRDTTGRFSASLISGNFWSTIKFTSNLFWGRELYSKGYWEKYSYYGASGLSVRCLKDTFSIVSVPTLSTTAITALSTTSATSGGNITSDGGASITSRGVVWATTPNPTITLSTKTSNGNGTGSFSSTLISLTPKTTYYVRAYATNSAVTAYGNEISFTTSDSTSVMGIPCPGTPTVKDIDGNTYNTVQIGSQCWTKENLRVTKYRDGSIIPMDESGGTDGNGIGETWSSRKSGARTVYGHSASNLATYGYLYNWYAVENPKALCPSGWHVPSRSEFDKLIVFLGGEEIAGGNMKSTGTTFWKAPNEGATNVSGFSGIPGGYRDRRGKFEGISLFGAYWSSTNTDINDPEVWLLSIGSENRIVGWTDVETLEMGASIRCIKDTISIVSISTLTTTAITSINTTSATSGGDITSDGGASITARGVVWSTSTSPTISLTTKTSDGIGKGFFTSSLTNLTPKTTYYVRAYATNSAGTGYGNEISFTTSDSSNVMGIPCPGTPTVKDIDGNSYNTVQIGTQCWTKENLRVTKYRDGSVMPLDESGGAEGNGSGQTWSSRTTGARTVYDHSVNNLTTYGYLYNWYAVSDTKGICPSGWHVPRDGEWTNLTNYLGGEAIAGGKIKTTGTVFWQSPNTGASNESGFSALPGGCRLNEGSFINFRSNAFFWSTTESSSSNAWLRSLSLYSGNVFRSDYGKRLGYSVRCLRD